MTDEQPFFQKLRLRIETLGHGLCVGVDPDFESLPALRSLALQIGDLPAIQFFASSLVDLAADCAAAIKFQSAFFEAAGGPGVTLLGQMVARAKQRGVLTILDAKRCDISSTMRAYGQATFDSDQADCMTVVPYMGVESFAPLLPWLRQGKGIYCVLRTSNPESEMLQELAVNSEAGIQKFYQTVNDRLQNWRRECGVEHAVGVVVGATVIESLPSVDADRFAGQNLLLPGLGAQGGVLGVRHESIANAAATMLYPISRGLLADAETALALSQADGEHFSACVRAHAKKLIEGTIPRQRN
jgi:orotidine-5'-phosphate decarboxylase